VVTHLTIGVQLLFPAAFDDDGRVEHRPEFDLAIHRPRQLDGAMLRFRVRGNLDATIKAIARHPVTDLEVTRPTLEELFLTYYQRGADA
jgi:hypothetical protein